MTTTKKAPASKAPAKATAKAKAAPPVKKVAKAPAKKPSAKIAKPKNNTCFGKPDPITEPVRQGRPSDYAQEVADKICLLLAEGMSLRTICTLDDDLPDRRTILRWLAAHDDFRLQYARAKEDGCLAMAEDLLDIADDGTNDWMEVQDKEGGIGFKINGEHVQRSRLRVDTRKWYLERIAAKKYGTKVGVNHDVSKPVEEFLTRICGTALQPVAKDAEGE